MRLLVFIIICTAIVRACRYNGEYRRRGERWVEGRFRLKCLHGPGWERVKPDGCVTLEGHWMPFFSTYRENGKRYNCRKSYSRYILEARSYD
ncbi:hypothetical protein GCK32_016171 [Trichostrongylus colubriformis]|uniref:Abnormal cell migration protein 18-like fibronectin type I domain-containing protein n=1 Tax=Trichostrongylus colubriformis TaxID=6319 RepID=A0AAN8FL13_TRICO